MAASLVPRPPRRTKPSVFVRARLGDHDLPPAVERTFLDVLTLAESLVESGKDDDWLDWLTGSETAWKAIEYALGEDPHTSAEKARDALVIALARTWSQHPDFDPRWAAPTAGVAMPGGPS